ncbi:MAG: glycoside hydrolase family 127 protein [Clostridia bacterium]|nr:glycoside hydrolase family 127 protein [Clostridia bacterium]
MTERMKERVFRGGENGQRDKMAVAAKLDYEFAPSSYFGKDTIFVKRIQLFDTWLWKKFVAQFRIYGVDDKKAERYHNGWRSEYWGKMMRGAALVCAYSQDDDLYEILTASVKDLLTTQDEKGRITTYSLEYEFNGLDLWGRKYVLLGLQYYLEICRDEALAEQIVEAMKKHADYIMQFIGPESEGKTPVTKATANWGGLNSSSILEPYVRLYNITGESKYLDYAEYIVSEGACRNENIFDTAYADEKAPFEYAQVKAYEMMSCFEGLMEYYRVTGIEKYRDAAIRFGYKVLETDVTVIGCCGCTHELFDNSAKMQTKPADYSQAMGIMQETCVTVTWMKTCHQLLRLTGDRAFADAIEQSFVNAYLGAFNTHQVVPPEINHERMDGEEKNWVPSFTLMPFDSYSPLTADIRGRKIGGQKFFDDHTFYGCCACIGSAGMGIMGRISVMENEKGLCFQYYIGGKVHVTTTKGAEAVLRVDTNYPYSTDVKVTVEKWDPSIGALSFRIPEWSERTVAKICGEELSVQGHYMTVKREFSEGDVIEVHFDDRMRRILPPYADGPDAEKYAAYAIGPVLLAKDARLGDYLHDSVSPAFDADGYVPYEKNEGLFMEIPDARMFINLKRADGEVVRLIDYSSAGKTYTKESECAAWLER